MTSAGAAARAGVGSVAAFAIAMSAALSACAPKRMAVRQRYPRAQIEDGNPVAGARLPRAYPGPGHLAVTAPELNAAGAALMNGATHLLVPTITTWTEMRTDDPIGAVMLPHDAVAISLRLMRLDPPGVAGELVFEARARVTLNQQAIGLLDDRFRRTVLRLIAGGP